MIITAGEVLTVNLEISNLSNDAKTPVLLCDFTKMGNLMTQGYARQVLSPIDPGKTYIHGMKILPAATGIQHFQGVSLEGYENHKPILASYFVV